MAEYLQQEFVEHLRYFGMPHQPLPPPPKTAKAAAELQAQIDSLLAQADSHAALPLQISYASFCFAALYMDDATTVKAVYAVVQNLWLRDEHWLLLHEWLLPRAVRLYGLASKEMRQLVTWQAYFLCDSADPRAHPKLTRAVRNVALHMPGGLGWGCATYTPLDEDSYNKHSVMQAKAEFIHTDGNLKLASDMLQRCVTYFDTLGPHWLGSARRATATMRLGMCEAELAGPSNTGHMSFLGTGRPNDPAVLEPYLTKAKRIAIRELGPEHRTTLEMMTGNATHLQSMGRVEQAVSLLQKANQLRKKTHGPYHVAVLKSQVTLSTALLLAGKVVEGQAMLGNAYEIARKLFGPSLPMMEVVRRATCGDVRFRP